MLTREQAELLQELEADPEYRWAGAVIRAALDPNRALVDDLGTCPECREFWYHRVTCSRNIERKE